MRGVLLWVPEIGRTLFAQSGRISLDPDGETRVTLENGSVLLASGAGARALRFASLTTQLPETGRPLAPSEPDELAGASLRELIALARPRADPGSRGQRAAVELHRRVALPAGTLLFGLLALPLALRLRALSRSSGCMAGIAVAIVYYGLVQLGDGLIAGRRVSVWLGVWLPDLALGALALLLLRGAAQTPSFGPGGERRRWLARLRPERVQGRRAAATGPTQRVRRRALQRHVAGRFLELAFAAVSFLVAGYLLVDMLERLEFFARYTASGSDLARYYLARIPLLASRVLPMALLLATALTASLLSVQNELTGMRGCGLVPARVLSVILWLCAAIAPLSFLLGDQVVPRTESIAHQVKQAAIWGRESGPGPAPDWFRVGKRLYEIGLLDPPAGRARNLRVYEIGADALPTQVIEAQQASYVGNGVWRLSEAAKAVVVGEAAVRVLAPTFVELDPRPPEDVSTIRMSVAELQELIHEAGEAGLDTTPYRVDLYAKLAAPLACLALPALGLLFATGGPPYPKPSFTLLVALVIAAGYVLLGGITVSLGYGRILPPPVAGAAPVVLTASLAAYLSSRVPDLRRFR